MSDETTKRLQGTIKVDEGQLQGHVDEAVRTSVEDTLNTMLEVEADQLCRAQRYERSAERVDTQAGHYARKLKTKAGEMTLKVPKLRSLPFETAIIECCRRREASVEEALVEMSLAGVSAPGRRHHRGALGHPGNLGDGEPTEPADLRADRRLAATAHHRHVSVCLPRWRQLETQLGRRSPERLRAHGDRRRHRRLPEHSRGRRRREGRPRGLAQLSPVPQEPRPHRRPAHHQRCVFGAAFTATQRLLPTVPPSVGFDVR